MKTNSINQPVKVYKSKLPEIKLSYKTGEFYKQRIRSSEDLYQVMKEMFNADTIEYCEEVILLFLNGANNTLGWMKHSSGGTAHTIVDIKMILAAALQAGATAITLAHNHPSGANYPSKEDENITKRLSEGCNAVGIRFLNHIIVCPGNGYYSFCDEVKM